DAEMKLIALSEVNFNVQKNSLNMITGPAGSGKTTLFHLIILMDRVCKVCGCCYFFICFCVQFFIL
ncbi:MAG: ATP-binding cassette domain-containing protein, partial [Nanoarchaeota archaeon]|nr:ATP-binding cassette domain-containing protein [Nanoarchaeota archaeon]